MLFMSDESGDYDGQLHEFEEKKKANSSVSILPVGRRTFLKGVIAALAGTAIALKVREEIKQSDASSVKDAEPIDVVEPEEESSSTLIDEIETFGDERPLAYFELERLRLQLNDEQKEMDSSAFYLTVGATQESILSFKQDKENLQTYLKRLEEKWNEILLPLNMNFVVRRVIIVDDETIFPRSRNPTYVNDGFSDSDGTWIFGKDDGYNWNNYYSEILGLNIAHLHELGHAVLHLQDGYSVDYNGRKDLSMLNDLSEQWREYHSYMRPEYSHDLMTLGPDASQYLDLSPFWISEIDKRLREGTIHDLSAISEGQGLNPDKWSTDFPEKVTIKPLISDDAILSVTSMEIYASSLDGSGSSGYSKIMEESSVYIGVGLEISTASLFKGTEFVNVADSTLLVRVTDTSGQTHWRWLDIRDFIMAKRTVLDSSVVQMFVRVVDSNDSPQDPAVWKIEYSR